MTASDRSSAANRRVLFNATVQWLRGSRVDGMTIGTLRMRS